mmetsp:Transcript_10027/g.40492  ORF Transcript_10027/g.40492 Transcript_10027/m.40492 type:complete len:238 (+) Transcript_10027:1770-2483(+)
MFRVDVSRIRLDGLIQRQGDPHRRVIRRLRHQLVQHERVHHPNPAPGSRGDALARREVIQSQPAVSRLVPRAAAPVRVPPARVRVKRPKRVHQSYLLQRSRPARALLRREPALLLRVRRVDVVDVFVEVSDVEVAADDHRLASRLPVEMSQVRPEVDVPLLEPVLQPFEFLSAVGHVREHQVERVKLQRERPTLVRVPGTIVAHALDDAKQLARVTGSLGGHGVGLPPLFRGAVRRR